MPDDAYFEAAYEATPPLHVRLAGIVGVPPNRVYPPDGDRQAYRVAIPGLKRADGTPALMPFYIGELNARQRAVYEGAMKRIADDLSDIFPSSDDDN